jgi:hypothetical protein
MVKKCGFCKAGIPEDQAFEVCARCGHGIWGDKMYEAIKNNMQDSQKKGDLFQGSVSEAPLRKAA